MKRDAPGSAISRYAAWQSAQVSPSPGTSTGVCLADVEAAAKRIAGMAVHTPVKFSSALAERVGGAVFLKLETMQPTGAFKLRGAANRLLALTDSERRRGVITVSTGNHGRAVAYAAREFGVRCVVCLSEHVPRNKIQAIVALGAEVDVAGVDQDAALERAERRAAAEALLMVHPFDDPFVIAGQGTIALELLAQVPDAATIIAPISGGGLVGGIALAAKALRPGVRVVAVASDRCPAMLRSVQAGRPVEVTEQASIADSLGGGIGLDNRLTFRMVRDLVDEIQLVSDAEVENALRFAFFGERLVAEGAAVAPLAALLRARPGDFPTPAVAVLTGDNVDPQMLLTILRGGYATNCAGVDDVNDTESTRR